MKQYLCIGTYTEAILFGTGEVFRGKGKGVSIAEFEDGIIKSISDAPAVNPSFLCVDTEKKKIYCVNEAKEYMGASGGGTTQFYYSSDGKMQQEITVNTEGKDPCHIVKSPDGRFLAVSNFASGSLSIFYLDGQGNITGEKEVFAHDGKSIHPIRQKGPHAHSTIFAPGGKVMYVPDLGTDRLVAYENVNGRVVAAPHKDVKVSNGSGPRYGEFSGDGKHFYLILELASGIIHFTYEAGCLREESVISTLPAGFSGDNICSDLHLSHDGKYLYASNRGHDSIACYEIADNGSLTLMEIVPSGGKTPRNFAVDPTGRYLLVGNQDSDNITIFQRLENGRLVQAHRQYWGSPVCIRFFNLS